MEKLITRFLKAFDGYDKAYGQHGSFKEKANGKMEGKAQTVIGDITAPIVERHFTADGNGLGIVPLRADDTCMFGAVDIDTVGVNALSHTIEELENKILSLGLPFIACTTKSGGVHLYCFTKEPVPAQLMVKRLKEWASLLSYGSSEIFPKQTCRANESDVGNWINLPYYDYKKSKRKAINKGKLVDLEEFLTLVEVVRVDKKELQNFQMEEMDENFDDAPPCLQILQTMGLEEGSRNNGLYNFAVYFKKKDEDSWQEKIEDFNKNKVKPSLSTKEAEAVTKSINRKDFFYKCNEYPICQYCNKSECRKRSFGIASSEKSALLLENLTKMVSGEEIIWFAEYQGKRIQLTTDELLNQTKLQKRFVECINKIFTPVKNSKWNETINKLLDECSVVQEPIQASRKGQFFELLDAFLTEGVSGEEKKDLLKHNTYIEDGIIYFRSFNLFEFLKNKRFKATEQEVWGWLKEQKARSQKMRVAKKPLNVWSINAPDSFQFEDEDESRM